MKKIILSLTAIIFLFSLIFMVSSQQQLNDSDIITYINDSSLLQYQSFIATSNESLNNISVVLDCSPSGIGYSYAFSYLLTEADSYGNEINVFYPAGAYFVHTSGKMIYTLDFSYNNNISLIENHIYRLILEISGYPSDSLCYVYGDLNNNSYIDGNYAYEDVGVFPRVTYQGNGDFYFNINSVPSIPVTPSITSWAIFDSAGAGLGIFMQILAVVLPPLLIGLAICIVIFMVGWGIAEILYKFADKNIK